MVAGIDTILRDALADSRDIRLAVNLASFFGYSIEPDLFKWSGPEYNNRGITLLRVHRSRNCLYGLAIRGTNSGVTVLWDKEFGFLKEVMVAPVRRTSLMIGRSLGALTIAIIQALATLGIALIIGTWFGFRIISVPGFLLAMGFAIITFFAFVGFGLTLGAMIENTEGFTTIIRMLEFPMFFLSGALLPITVIKGIPVLYQLQFINPLTYGVDGVRGLLTGVFYLPPWLDLTVIVAFALLFLFLGAYTFSRMEVD